jgi:hypothetical protein
MHGFVNKFFSQILPCPMQSQISSVNNRGVRRADNEAVRRGNRVVNMHRLDDDVVYFDFLSSAKSSILVVFIVAETAGVLHRF